MEYTAEYNHVWIKKEPEDIENRDEDEAAAVDPLADKQEEEEDGRVKLQPIETVILESTIIDESDGEDLQEEDGGEGEEEEEDEEDEEEKEVENVGENKCATTDGTNMNILYPNILIENDRPVELEVESEDFINLEVEEENEDECGGRGGDEEEEQQHKEGQEYVEGAMEDYYKGEATSVTTSSTNHNSTDLSILYPNIFTKTDQPDEIVKESAAEKRNKNKKMKKNGEIDPIAKSGVLIHCPQCKTLLMCNSDLISHRLVCSAMPNLVEKPVAPPVKYPSFCDPKLANPNAVVRQRVRSKNKPKRQLEAVLFEIRDGLFCCTQCHYKTASDAGLRHHRRAHQEKLESFKCGFCDYGCNRSRDLERHLRTHTGEKPFKCEICGYACSSLSNLKRHTMRHTGELPYACRVCEFRCARSGTLEIHERTHNKQKPYQCRLCSRAFAAASSLKRHEGMHAEVGHLVCEHCEYRCGQMHLLKRHMKRHEREKLAAELRREVLDGDGLGLRHASSVAEDSEVKDWETSGVQCEAGLRHAPSDNSDLSGDLMGLRHASSEEADVEVHAFSDNLDLSEDGMGASNINLDSNGIET